MRKLYILSALILSVLTALAQSGGTINGQVIDGKEKTVEAATIALIKAKDSSIVKYAIANKEGKFQFVDVAYGHYLVTISAVGHQKGFSEWIQLTASSPIVQLKTIELIPVSKTMATVIVTSKKPLIESKIDRTVVNVDASITNTGSSALEVLEKSPGVSVDRDGNISLKGKQGVLVLVDGRPTQLSGPDLANLLRSMNASQLDQIEIMTNPPAKFDAAGNAGVINIKTKKNKAFGYNGNASVTYTQGIYARFNESFNFNYRQGKWNLFTSLNHGYRNRKNRLNIERNFLDENTKMIVSRFDQQARMKNNGSFYNAKIGADYFAGKNTTIGVVFSGFTSPGQFINHNTTRISNQAGVLQSKTNAISKQDELWENGNVNLNFRQVLDSTGKELTADLDYNRYHSGNDQSLSNYYFDAHGLPLSKGDTLYGRLPQNINIYSARVDYTMPLKKEGARFEAGLKTSRVKTDNNAIYDTVHNGQIFHDLSRTNGFNYEETIHAAYVNLSGPLSKKVTAQLGVRLENTISKGYSDGYAFDAASGNFLPSDTSFSKNYTQLFPTAFLQYKASEKHTWGLNYGRRIRRPNYESLNPFIEYLDRYTYQQGNPNLKPQFSHNIEFSHNYKGVITTTFNYTNTTDIIQQILEQKEETKETFVKQGNIARQRQYGLSVSANMPLTKWWTNNLYINIFNNQFSGLVNETPVTIEATTLLVSGSQQFKITKTLTGEIGGWFRTAGIEGVFEAKSMGGLNAGFSQQILKGKGTIRLNARDIFWTQGFRAISKYGTVDVKINELNDSRQISLGFSYRFNKGKMNGAPKRRANSSNDEQNRVGVSGN